MKEKIKVLMVCHGSKLLLGKSVGKSRVFRHRKARIDEFTTDLPQLTKKSSEKKTLPAMVVFFLCPGIRTTNKVPMEMRDFLREMDICRPEFYSKIGFLI